MVRRAKLAGYRGGKSALYALIHSIRPKPVRLLTRFEGLPGEFCQHDFGQVDVSFLDGTRKRVHFFASRLKYSRWTEVSLVEDETAESLVRALVDHFASMGGIPLLSVFDRPKTIAQTSDRDGQVTQWNPAFAGVALDLGLGIELCWPRSPQQKGSVENLVGWVKGSFFKQRRFLDQEDLLQQLREWLIEVNTQRPSRATSVIPQERMKEETPRLRPLKVAPTELALRIPITVGPTGMVLYDTHEYSMPPDSLGIPGTLYLYRERVRIVAGRYEAIHPRLFGPAAKSTLPEHRAQRVAAVSGKRAKRYMQREHLLALGAADARLPDRAHAPPPARVGARRRAAARSAAAARRRGAASRLCPRPGRAGHRRRVHRPLPGHARAGHHTAGAAAVKPSDDELDALLKRLSPGQRPPRVAPARASGPRRRSGPTGTSWAWWWPRRSLSASRPAWAASRAAPASPSSRPSTTSTSPTSPPSASHCSAPLSAPTSSPRAAA